MTEKIYIISSGGPESYEPMYVQGPVVKDWKEYCESLSPEIAQKAIELNTIGNKNIYNNTNTDNSSIEENCMAYAALEVLKSKGYKQIQFDEHFYGWCGDWSNIKSINIWNLKVKLDFHQESYKRMLSEGDTEQGLIDYLKRKIEDTKEEIEQLSSQ